jgi:hypothetical protein
MEEFWSWSFSTTECGFPVHTVAKNLSSKGQLIFVGHNAGGTGLSKTHFQKPPANSSRLGDADFLNA